jgi:hypothetical protein
LLKPEKPKITVPKRGRTLGPHPAESSRGDGFLNATTINPPGYNQLSRKFNKIGRKKYPLLLSSSTKGAKYNDPRFVRDRLASKIAPFRTRP